MHPASWSDEKGGDNEGWMEMKEREEDDSVEPHIEEHERWHELSIKIGNMFLINILIC